MTADLAGFLLARIAEDERLARDAEATWSQVRIHYGTSADADQRLAREAFVLNINPWRVLAECEAKRRIVEIESRWRTTKDVVLASSGPDYNGRISVTWQPDWSRPSETEIVSAQEFRERFTEPSPPSETLRLLALPYADHPDYRDEWRP